MALAWPDASEEPPPELSARLTANPEARVDMLLCGAEECRQYLAGPVLCQGVFSGILVLRRSLADSLRSFHNLTGAEVAILTEHWTEVEGQQDVRKLDSFAMAMPAITHAETTGGCSV